MKNLLLPIFCLLLLTSCQEEAPNPNFITSDIDNFWAAFDKIQQTQDSIQQYQYLQDLFLSKISEGQQAMIEARNYTGVEYLQIINDYPLFWTSIRANTLKAKDFANEINSGVDKFKQLYPNAKPAKVYFTMGAFRSPGTTMEGQVLIGSEFAFGDKNTVTTEFSENMEYVKDYHAANPIKDLVFLNVHEYIHTQQQTAIGSNLLTQALREGISEFLTVTTLGLSSPTPAIAYGKKNDAKTKAQFEKEMFHLSYRYWLWSSMDNEFQTRDLAYYVGYAIAEKYYNAASDKKQAIQELVELDFKNPEIVESFVDKTGYFSKPVQDLKQIYEDSRPTVVGIQPFKNGDQKVKPGTTQITIAFSSKMNTQSRGFDYGPLGENHVLSVKKIIGFSEDGKSFTYEADLKPNHQHQVLLTNRFQNENGVPLDPYLIDIKTK